MQTVHLAHILASRLSALLVYADYLARILTIRLSALLVHAIDLVILLLNLWCMQTI